MQSQRGAGESSQTDLGGVVLGLLLGVALVLHVRILLLFLLFLIRALLLVVAVRDELEVHLAPLFGASYDERSDGLLFALVVIRRKGGFV